MPVKKSFARPMMDEPMAPIMPVTSTPAPMHDHSMHGCGHEHCEKHGWCGWIGKKLLSTFAGILVVYLIVFFGVLIRNEVRKYDFIGQADRPERTIRVEADGKVSVKPDIAMTTMGVTTEAATVAEAQQKNTDTVNKLVAKVKELGVDAADIQTKDYSVYPAYNYPTDGGKPEPRGYTISQNVAIKIRDLAKANSVLGLAGEVGATNVSGLEFTIDDKEAYLAEARTDALKKVNEKATALSNMLGLKLTGIVSYDEYESSASPQPYYSAKAYDMSVGGAMPSTAPQIEAGTNDVSLHVGITFELK